MVSLILVGDYSVADVVVAALSLVTEIDGVVENVFGDDIVDYDVVG